MAMLQPAQGEQGVPAPEDEMKRMRDMVGAAIAFQMKPLVDKIAALESRLPEKPAQPQAQPQRGGYQQQGQPQQQRMSQAEAMYLMGILQEQGYIPPQGQQTQPDERQSQDYSDVVEDMMDTLRDAHPQMTRQEARAISIDVITEAEKTGVAPEDVFAGRWDAENAPGVERKIFQPAIITRLNRVAAKYGQQLTPLQQQIAEDAAQGQGQTAGAKTTPAIAGRGTQSMPIASQTKPVNPSRAKGTADRDKAVSDGVDQALAEIDGKAVPD